MDRKRIKYDSFAEKTVQNRRHYKRITLSNNQNYTIHDVVPVYLIPKTPTLYARKHQQYRVIFARIQSSILQDDGVEFTFTDGNAASKNTKFFTDLDLLSELPWEVLEQNAYWPDFPDGKRKRNSEFMIFPNIPINRISELGVFNNDAYHQAREIISRKSPLLNVSMKPDWFF